MKSEDLFAAIGDVESITIHNCYGTLYHHSNGDQTLIWLDEAQGIGFTLFTEIPDPGLDLPAIARSVAPGEPLTPTHAAASDAALKELGDYRITELPDGFTETALQASPPEHGCGWYAYVRRWYGDQITAENTIYFDYEHFELESDEPMQHPIEPVENVPETILQDKGGGKAAVVQSMTGAVQDGHIVWVDWDTQVIYEISAAGRSSQEKLILAQSVQKVNWQRKTAGKIHLPAVSCNEIAMQTDQTSSFSRSSQRASTFSSLVAQLVQNRTARWESSTRSCSV